MKKLLIVFVALILLSFPAFANNLLINGDFSSVEEDIVYSWKFSSYGNIGKTETINEDGKNVMVLSADKPDHTFVWQSVKIDPSKAYCLSANVKIEAVGAEGVGAAVGIHSKSVYSELKKTTDGKYEPLKLYFQSGDTSIGVMLTLGNYGRLNTGKVYFKDVFLTEVDKSQIAEGKLAVLNPTVSKGFDKLWLLVIGIFIVSMAFSIFYLYGKRKSGSDKEQKI